MDKRDLYTLLCTFCTCYFFCLSSQILSGMTELLSSSSNYSTYRRVYNECGGFKIPILGVHLKDLVSLNEALPDYLDNGKINVSKLQSLYQHILELTQLQKASPPFKANKDVILLLTVSTSQVLCR